ncbi:organomercurial lyase [Desulfosarcina widdelii]|uniref:organomercurial lyase n=1 Tax=Desulfosarcina widdelii TaxID=947919 RepID=UPI00147837FF
MQKKRLTRQTHQFVINDHTLWTWCVWNSLFLPVLLKQTVIVASSCPAAGKEIAIRLTVTPKKVVQVY